MDRVKGANRLATPSLNIAHRQTYFDLAPYCVFKQSESSPIFGNGQIFLKLQALTSLEKTQEEKKKITEFLKPQTQFSCNWEKQKSHEV